MLKAVLINSGLPNFNLFMNLANQMLNRTVTRRLDSERVDPRTHIGYLTMLAELKVENSSPIRTLENPGTLTEHLFFSFAVISTSDLPCLILEETSLKLVRASAINNLVFSIVSGTLAEWDAAIRNRDSNTISSYTKQFLEACRNEFSLIGLNSLWGMSGGKESLKRLTQS